MCGWIIQKSQKRKGENTAKRHALWSIREREGGGRDQRTMRRVR